MLKIKVKIENVCLKAIYDRLKNAKISALQVILIERHFFMNPN